MAKAAELLCERWTLVLIRELVAGSTRFNELRRGLPLMSPALLSRRLKQLQEAGVIQRVAKTRGYHYELTPAGKELQPLVEQMGIWGHRWVGNRLSADDWDAGLLMWDIRRGVDARQFPDDRVVIHIHFSDAPKKFRNWWLVSENRYVDLCMTDPGYDVDVVMNCRLPALISVWLCRCTLADTQRAGDIEVLGDKQIKNRLPAWLQGSSLARLGETSLRERSLES